MPRPEMPITGDGPAADLACALRRIRVHAGKPSYRELAKRASRAPSALAQAADGTHCPSWDVTKSYVTACGADPQAVRILWERADLDLRRRQATRNSGRVRLATVKQLPTRASSDAAGSRGMLPGNDLRNVRRPDPWSARTPADFVHQLRALRAWGGQPGVKQISRAAFASGGHRVGSSTLYDALSRKRTSLPPLHVVQAVVAASGGSVEDWTRAWQALSLREFEKANPRPLAAEPQTPRAEQSRGGTVHALERPAQ